MAEEKTVQQPQISPTQAMQMKKKVLRMLQLAQRNPGMFSNDELQKIQEMGAAIGAYQDMPYENDTWHNVRVFAGEALDTFLLDYLFPDAWKADIRTPEDEKAALAGMGAGLVASMAIPGAGPLNVLSKAGRAGLSAAKAANAANKAGKAGQFLKGALGAVFRGRKGAKAAKAAEEAVERGWSTARAERAAYGGAEAARAEASAARAAGEAMAEESALGKAAKATKNAAKKAGDKIKTTISSEEQALVNEAYNVLDKQTVNDFARALAEAKPGDKKGILEALKMSIKSAKQSGGAAPDWAAGSGF